MTTLAREVRRVIPRERGRSIVVRLIPARGSDPARIEFRESRTRRWFALNLEAVFVDAVRRAVESERYAKRRTAKRARLSMVGGVK